MKLKKFLLSTCFLLFSITNFAVELPKEEYTPFVNESFDLTPRATNINSNMPNFPELGLRAGGVHSLSGCTPASSGGCSVCCTDFLCSDCDDPGKTFEESQACYESCAADHTSCVTACMEGGSLPLNGSEWFMLVLVIMYGSYLTYKHKLAIN